MIPTDVDAADQRVGESRDRLDKLVAELDRRRHVVTRARKALRERPHLELALGLLVIALAGGTVALAVRARRKKPKPQNVEPAVTATTLAMTRPETPLGKKLMTTALTAILSVAVKAWAQRLFSRVSSKAPEGTLRPVEITSPLGKG